MDRALVIPVITEAVAIGLFMFGGFLLISITIAAVGLLFAAIYPPIYRAKFDALNRDYALERGMRGVIGPITLILSDERLIEITETTRSEVRWENMNGVDISDDYTFIRVTGLAAAVVPRHGFKSAEEYEAVKNFVLDKLNRTT